jgi:hypothetical protein
MSVRIFVLCISLCFAVKYGYSQTQSESPIEASLQELSNAKKKAPKDSIHLVLKELDSLKALFKMLPDAMKSEMLKFPNELLNKNSELTKRNDSLKIEIKKYKDSCELKLSELKTKNNEINGLNSQLLTKNGEIQRLTAESQKLVSVEQQKQKEKWELLADELIKNNVVFDETSLDRLKSNISSVNGNAVVIANLEKYKTSMKELKETKRILFSATISASEFEKVKKNLANNIDQNFIKLNELKRELNSSYQLFCQQAGYFQNILDENRTLSDINIRTDIINENFNIEIINSIFPFLGGKIEKAKKEPNLSLGIQLPD